MKFWSLDGETWFTPAEFRRELGVCERTFKEYRRLGIVPKPAKVQQRGYRGTRGLWTPQQVVQTRARLLAMRSETRGTAVERLGHARVHQKKLTELGRLSWDVLRAGPLRESFRRLRCDVPLAQVPHNRRDAARAEIARVLSLMGARA